MRVAAGTLIILLFVIFSYTHADNVITVTGTEGNMGDNLDLRAVGSLFGDCKNLEDFENQLNNPDLSISNLDLNRDGQVDYLRVVETVKEGLHLVTLQAVIGENQFQDVATIRLEKDNKEGVTVQIVGDAGIYGDGYIIEPTYANPQVFSLLFRTSHYRPWRSPFRWGHYPNHYRPWRPHPLALYQSNIQIQINTGTTSNHFKKSRGTITTTSPHNNTQPSKTSAPNSRTYSTQSTGSTEGNSPNNQKKNRILTTRPRQ